LTLTSLFTYPRDPSLIIFINTVLREVKSLYIITKLDTVLQTIFTSNSGFQKMQLKSNHIPYSWYKSELKLKILEF